MSFCCETHPRARKQHRCYFCDEPILKGEVHEKRVGVWDGDFGDMRMHTECSEATKTWTHDDYETFDPGTLVRGQNEFRYDY